HTAQRGKMFSAPGMWPDLGGPMRPLSVLGTMGILTLVLCSCSGKKMDVEMGVPSFCLSFSGLGIVFIHTNSSLYSLPCSPVEIEVADPIYHWVRDRPAPRAMPVTKEGHLLFQHFQTDDSGKYSCIISYVKHGIPVSQTFQYHIFGYHVVGGLDTVLLFHSMFCKDEWNEMFLQNLQKQLKQLEIKHHCEVHFTDIFCFPSLSNYSDRFIIQVQLEVSPFGPGWDEDCKSLDMEMVTDCYRYTVWYNLGQVQFALIRFFEEHKSFHITGLDIPDIHFTNKYIGSLKTKECIGGYGQTKELYRCHDCCILCPPGTFSPPKNNECCPCPVGTYSVIYGATSCTPCKDGMITKVPGASSMRDCVKDESTEQVVLIVNRIPPLILIILPLLLGLEFLFCLYSCYQFCREYGMSPPSASQKTESATSVETGTSFVKVPRESSLGGPDPEAATDSSHLDTYTPQGGDEENIHEAPTLAVTTDLATVTDEETLVPTSED
ncbi:ZPBP2 protein, partial [Todus mexicanus]|nr:ZPBP2 protein [Todus mexicanus]